MSGIDCPHCERTVNAHTNQRTGAIEPPAEHAFMFCWHCRKPSRYVRGPLGTMMARELTDHELAVVEPQIRVLRAAVAQSASADEVRARLGDAPVIVAPRPPW